jgi:hypothetical protein
VFTRPPIRFPFRLHRRTSASVSQCARSQAAVRFSHKRVFPGEKVGEGRVQATQPLIFSTDETTDIGEDFGMPVTSDYSGASSRFNGKIDLVQIDLGDDNHDHLIDQEELIRIAMSRQ